MLDMWVPRENIPEENKKEFPDDGNLCVLIKIKDRCTTCNHLHAIYMPHSGSKDCPTHFINPCLHYLFYSHLFNFRVTDDDIDYTIIKAKTPRINSANDGAKCAGRCGSWVPMATANQADGSFICYGCRSSF